MSRRNNNSGNTNESADRFDNTNSNSARNGRGRNNQRSNNGKNKRGSNKKYSGNDARNPKSGNTGRAGDRNSATSSLNDISWYTANPELLAAAAQVSFPNRPGMTVDAGKIEMPSDIVPLSPSAKIRIPGIMAIHYLYSWGYSDGPNSPASIAAAELWSVIRSKFSGALDEDAPDLFMYCCALDQIHAYIAWLKRLYKCAFAYSSNNYDFPHTLMEAILWGTQLTPADIANHRMQLWSYINELVNMVNVFWVPDNMSVFARHRWMNENVYLDAPDMNSQAYVFTPVAFYVVDDTTETGTELVAIDFTKSIDTVEDLFNFGCEMVRRLKEWDDAYTINGHIQRAFEGSPMYRADLQAQAEDIMPVFVPEVLTQIENMKFFGTDFPVAYPSMSQDPNTNSIIFKPRVEDSSTTHLPFINLHSMQPTAAEVTIATRLAPVAMPDGRLVGGTEIPLYATLFSNSAPGETHMIGQLVDNLHINLYADTNVKALNAMKDIKFLLMYQAWRHAPIFWVTAWSEKSTTEGLTYFRDYGATPTGDIANVAVLSHDMASNIHRVCIYSEFNCFGRR